MVELRKEMLKYNEIAFTIPLNPDFEPDAVLQQLRAEGYKPRLENFVATSGHIVYCGVWVREPYESTPEPEQPATLAGFPPTAAEWAEAFKNTFPSVSLSEWSKKQVWDKDRFPDPDVGEPDNFVEEFHKARARHQQSTFEKDEQLRKDDPDEFHAKFDAQEDGE